MLGHSLTMFPTVARRVVPGGYLLDKEASILFLVLLLLQCQPVPAAGGYSGIVLMDRHRAAVAVEA